MNNKHVWSPLAYWLRTRVAQPHHLHHHQSIKNPQLYSSKHQLSIRSQIARQHSPRPTTTGV